jgi:hypothetical protein
MLNGEGCQELGRLHDSATFRGASALKVLGTELSLSSRGSMTLGVEEIF